MNIDIKTYNETQIISDNIICNLLYQEICINLPKAESKIWHGHPVWFINENPIVGYSKLKNCIQLLFWSGQSFDEEALIKTGKFKAAEIRYNSIEQINTNDLKNWLIKSEEIQWDYKNITKQNGLLERLK